MDDTTKINIPQSQFDNKPGIGINNTTKINALHSKFSEYGHNAKEWMRKCVLLLPKIKKYRVWEKKGFGSIYEYAAKLTGMSHNTVDDALRLLKKIEDKPKLKSVAERKGLGAIRPIAAIATKETESFWTEKAESMSKHTLEVYVREFNGLSRPGTEKETIQMELKPATAERLKKLNINNDWNKVIEELLNIREEKLNSEKPEAVEATSKHIPAKIEKFINKRSSNICEYLSCTKKAAIKHHTERFAISQNHDPDKIRALCTEHERLAHLGLIENEEADPKFWTIKKYANELDPKYDIDRVVVKKRGFP